MRKILLTGFFLLALLLKNIFSPSSLYAQKTDNTEPYRANQIIVRYKDSAHGIFSKSTPQPAQTGIMSTILSFLGFSSTDQPQSSATADSLSALSDRFGIQEQDSLERPVDDQRTIKLGYITMTPTPEVSTEDPLARVYRLNITKGTVEDAVQAFQNSGLVEYAEPNYMYNVSFEPNDDAYQGKSSSGGVMNMWALKKIQMPQAWDISQGSDAIVVAVLDTGVDYSHEDLPGPGKGDRLIRGANCSSGSCTGTKSDDTHYHGTHVSGTIGALLNNNLGVSGINGNVKILGVKVLDSNGSGSIDTIAQGIRYAADYPGVRIINMSLGGPSGGSTLQNAVTYAYKTKNILVVSAAGNDKSSNPNYPAAYADAFSVGATDQNDGRASFSTYGSTVDIAAPGVGIWSTYPTYTGKKYAALNGTSMSTPHVSGVAALVLAKNPSLSAADLRKILVDSGDPIDASLQIGGKRINAYKALQAAGSGSVPTTPTTPTATLAPGQPSVTPNAKASITPVQPTLTSVVKKPWVIWTEQDGVKLSVGAAVKNKSLLSVCFTIPAETSITFDALKADRTPVSEGNSHIEGVIEDNDASCIRGYVQDPTGIHYYVVKDKNGTTTAETNVVVN